MNSDLRNLIALQDIDQKIASLQKQIADVPNKVQAFQEELQRMQKAHEDRVTHGQELAKRRRAFEGEVEMMRAKLSKLKDQLMAVKTNKEYTAMLHEIQMAEDQIRSKEDLILEIMEEVESMEHDLKGSEKDAVLQSAQLKDSILKLDGSVAGLEAEVARLRDEKGVMEERVASELLSRYHQIAQARKGIALAEAKGELCTACHVRIRPQVYANLLRSETIYCCDSCDRILFLREAL